MSILAVVGGCVFGALAGWQVARLKIRKDRERKLHIASVMEFVLGDYEARFRQ